MVVVANFRTKMKVATLSYLILRVKKNFFFFISIQALLPLLASRAAVVAFVSVSNAMAVVHVENSAAFLMSKVCL